MISWIAPDNGGSAITSYTVYIQTSDINSYKTELTFCDGSIVTIISQLSCTIPSIVLHQSPFNLSWGSHVYAKILATNNYGNSLLSLDGDGGIIVAVPDAPINLQEVPYERTMTTLGISWSDGLDLGGLPITSY